MKSVEMETGELIEFRTLLSKFIGVYGNDINIEGDFGDWTKINLEDIANKLDELLKERGGKNERKKNS